MTDDSVHPLRDRLYSVLTLGKCNRVLCIFYTILFIGAILSMTILVLSLGKSLEFMLFFDRHDYFMDYFHSIFHSLDDPYFEHKIIYPALTTSVYRGVGIILEAISGTFNTPFDIRGSIAGMTSYILMTILALLVLYWIFHKNEEVSRRETAIFYTLTLVSFPMLFTIDRGNSILFAVIFSLLFFIGHDSKNKKIRYLSYISLGIAAGIKIYPFLFGLILLRKYIQLKKVEDLKELIICIIIGALIFLIPFVFFEGSLVAMFGNATVYSGPVDAPWLVNISSIIQATSFLCGNENYLLLANAGTIVSFMFLVLIVLYLLFYKNAEKWEIIYMLSGAIILCTGIGVQYILLYLIIPAWYFVKSNPVMNIKNVTFAILLALILMSLPIPYQPFSYVKGILVWAIVVLFLISALREFINGHKTVNTDGFKKDHLG